MDAESPLPGGRPLHLAGRGRTWVYDSGPHPDGGPALVLLHGWTSTAALNWSRCFAPLAECYRVVALDHRGHGRGIRSRLPFRLEDCADDTAALIDALELGPAVVVGYSMGGPIAQLLWRRHPDRVAGLVLCATAARFAARREFSGAMAMLGLGASIGLSLLPAVARNRGMAAATGRWSSSRAAAPWARREWARNDPSALIQGGLALGRFDSTPWLAEIHVPTAVVVTEQDVTVSPGRQRQLAASIPGASTHPVAGTHRVCSEEPDLFVAALLRAVSAVRGPDPAPVTSATWDS